MRKTALIFLVVLVLLAFADIRFSIGGRGIFTLSLFEMWAYVCVLPMLAVLHLARKLTVPPSKWLFFYLAWAWVAAVLLWDNSDYTLPLDLKCLIPAFLAYVFLLLAVDGVKDFNLVLKCWVAAGVVNACLALSQFAFSGPYPVAVADDAFEKLDLTGEQTSVLVTGFFSHPNSFAQIMIPWFVVAGVAWLTSRKFMSWKSWAWLLAFVLFGAVLYTTMVKGALLWSGAGILLGTVMAKWKRTRSVLSFAFLWVALVAAITAIGAFFTEDYGLESLGTLHSRVEFIVASWNLFLDNPLQAVIGGGTRLWESYADTYAGWQFENAHNVYLNQILIYGVIGTSFLIAFIVSALRYGLKGYKDAPGAPSPFPFIGAVLAMTGEYFFEPSFNDPIQKYQLFFTLAAVVISGRLLSTRKSDLQEARVV